jgi:hypothetical protein
MGKLQAWANRNSTKEFAMGHCFFEILLDTKLSQGIFVQPVETSLSEVGVGGGESDYTSSGQNCKYDCWFRRVVLFLLFRHPFFFYWKIRFNNRFKNDRGKTCNITVDCTDCAISEPWLWEMDYNRQFF